MESAPALKWCPCCTTNKDKEAFSPDRRNKDGLNYRCKACSANYVYSRRKVDPEPYRTAVRKYRESLAIHTP